MKNNLIFTGMSLLFIIVCVIFVLLTKDGENTYVTVINPNNYKAADVYETIVSAETGVLDVTAETDIFTEEAKTDKININTASLSELTTLTGIGEVIGQRIIDYRSENGLFYSIEEIMEVKGVGEKIFENIKEHIKI